ALDVAVNNAGIGGPQGPTGAYPLDGWHQVIDVNLKGVFYGMRAETPARLATSGGSIVNMASILGSRRLAPQRDGADRGCGSHAFGARRDRGGAEGRRAGLI